MKTVSDEDRNRKGRPRVTPQLFRGDIVNQAFMVLQKKTPLKEEETCKKHEQGTLDRHKFVLWSEESKFEMFDSNRRVFFHHEAWRWWCDGACW
jgi:hypothetical protein